MKKTIVILEDDLDSQEVYKVLLEEEGFEAVGFENSQDVIDYIQNNPVPHALVSDLTFPGPSAQDMVKSFGDKKFPLIVVSGKSSIREEAEKLGTSLFLPKPFNLDTFIEMIKKI